MIFRPATLDGVWLVDLEPARDHRGFFARTFCEREFAAHGLHERFEQQSISRNPTAHTLRGMHFSRSPREETKLVRCIRGSVYDVVIDLRPGSTTLGRWFGATLSAEGGQAIYIPPGFAHGFLTLEPDCDVLYAISPLFVDGYGDGVRWNDPVLAIDWPTPCALIGERDANYPDWRP